MALKLRRGLSENLADIVPAEGELIYTTDTKLIYVGDGAASGDELTPLGTGGGGSLTGITDDASTSVLTLTDSLITLARPAAIVGDLTIGDYQITGTFDINTEGSITLTGTGLDGIVTANEFVGDMVTSDVTGDLYANNGTSRILDNGTDGSDAVFTGSVTGNITTNNITTDGVLVAQSEASATSVNFSVVSDEETSILTFTRNSASDLSGQRLYYGQLNFGRNDSVGGKSTAYIVGGEDEIVFGADPAGTFTAPYNMFWKNGKLGIGTEPTTVLDVAGNANIVGDITANAFKGTFVADDSSIVIDGLTGEVNLANSTAGAFNVTNPQSGQILAWNGSEWTNENNSGGGGGGSSAFTHIGVAADDSAVRLINEGETIQFVGGTGISTTSDAEGTITISADAVSGLSSRASVAGTTASIADGADDDLDITGYKGYMLYKIQTDGAAWVRIYVNAAKRTADAARTEGQDPGPDAGVIAEVITTGAETVIVAPGVIGFNDESPVTNVIPCAVRNKTGSTGTVTVTLTAVEMEV